jgi:hypothetical protein
MKVINAIIGIKAASSYHPCPICLVHKSNFAELGNERQRVAHTRNTSNRNSENMNEPLLSVKPSRIVPIPLHIFLGLCNRIIEDTLAKIVDDDTILHQSSLSVKTTSLTPQVGRSRLYSLTGPELVRYIKQEKIYDLYNECSYDDYHEQLEKLQSWMLQLHDNLLTKKQWSEEKLEDWKSFVDELLKDWKTITLTRLTPKCHMLLHIAPFVKQFDHLGKYSESQLESYHAKFAHKQKTNHFNYNNNKEEQLRRVLADFTLCAIVDC